MKIYKVVSLLISEISLIVINKKSPLHISKEKMTFKNIQEKSKLIFREKRRALEMNFVFVFHQILMQHWFYFKKCIINYDRYKSPSIAA